MTPEFIRLLFLERVRSFSFGRDLISSIMVLVLIVFILFYLVGIAIFMGFVLKNQLGVEDVPAFLNSAAIYYLLGEFVVRFFFQKTPLFDLNRYLHLPIKRSGIIHFLLGKSLISTFTVVALILFLPVTITEITAAHGPLAGFFWLATIMAFSLSLHWLVLWVKEAGSRKHPAFLALLVLPALPFILLYFNIFNIGAYTAPFFSMALSGPVPLITGVVFCLAGYRLIFGHYIKNAYLDQAQKPASFAYSSSGSGLFSGFGVPGIMAETELKLILRHKKSRSYLFMSFLFVFYGLLFYELPEPGEPFAISVLHIFVGIFITGLFFVQYGQFLMSWNSSFFDFYLNKENGIRDLMRGKVLLLSLSSIAAFLLALPYLYFGWQIILIHTAALLFNVGIGIHIIVLMSLWNPKPMDINKGAMFNYDGIGMAQFLMAIPFFISPYVIYVPVLLLANHYAALVAMSLAGLAGILLHNRITDVSANIVKNNRHKISSAFRRGT
ncbi:MAG TPA: DUF5687 family protein [Balneolaceae bacterium]|nr:DUF5687 family protein [Balneolaceae bacterium]